MRYSPQGGGLNKRASSKYPMDISSSYCFLTNAKVFYILLIELPLSAESLGGA
jgi:hypothetical protein